MGVETAVAVHVLSASDRRRVRLLADAALLYMQYKGCSKYVCCSLAKKEEGRLYKKSAVQYFL